LNTSKHTASQQIAKGKDDRKGYGHWGTDIQGDEVIRAGMAQNWELCLSIVNALVHLTSRDDSLEYQVSVLTYSSQTLDLPPHLSSNSVEQKKSDFTSKSLQEAFTGQDLVISTMFGGDSELQICIIDALVAAGVKRFVPHEFGHDTLNRDIQTRIPKYAGRAQVLAYLQNNTKGLRWIGIATGYTLDNNLISGDMGFEMKWHSATIHGIGTELFAASSLKRVGKVVASVIQHWDSVKSNYLYAAGVITSANEVLRCAEKVTDREWTVGSYDVEDSVSEGQKRIERGFPDAGMALLERSILYDERLNASAPFETQSSNDLLELSPESVEDMVGTAYHDLQHYGKPGCGCSS
jgi:hypothetical protein